MNNLLRAIICDLDGTLALLERDPFDYKKLHLDKINIPIAKIISLYDGKVIIVSGREDKFKPQTESWLKKHGIKYESIYMRKSGDYRKDSVVKREVYERNIKDKYEIEFVLEDRDQAVKMWREELKLICLQVNYGAF
jgi:hypothetical protein